METQELLKKLESLSLRERAAIETLVDSLLQKQAAGGGGERPKRLGAMKGLVEYMAPDFDEPLDDFKAYM